MCTTYKIRFSDCDPLGHLNNVQYLKYMQDAREDHVEAFFGFSFNEYVKRTGCAWVTVKNEIAYLKEAKANAKVKISSHTINISDRISTVEIIMKSEDEKITHAVLWTTVIYFNLQTRKSEVQPEDLKKLFSIGEWEVEQKTFDERAEFLRIENKANIS